MGEIVAVSMLIDLLKFAGAVTAAWGILKVLDRMSDNKFTDALDLILQDPKAVAIYFGLRFFGVCMIAAAFVK